jgi:3-methyladenine DNA glycosylase AlkC
MEPQETFQGERIGSGLLQNVWRNIHQRRTTLGNECRRELATCPVRDVERATICVKNAHSPLYNESVQFLRSNCSSERFPQSVEEIEDQRFLDLNLLM